MIKMYLNVICVLATGVFVVGCASRDNTRFKSHAPNFVQNHHHSKYVYLKDKESGDYGDQKKAYVVLQKPEDKKKYNLQPYFDDDGYKNSWKSLRSEKYETETIDNPHSDNPANRYIVKGVYKVREKLPFEQTTTGYDHEYQYPSPEADHDYHNSAKFIDYQNTQNDPFSSDHEAIKYENVAQDEPKKPKKKPLKLRYHYQSPTQDFDYYKNVHLIDFYLAKNKEKDVTLPLQDEPKKSDDYDYLPPSQKYTSSLSYDYRGPSDEQSYQNYKTDGPSFDYSDRDFADHS